MSDKIGALFDLDGVLIDSEGAYTEFWREIDRDYPTGVENFPVAIKGTTLPMILRYFPQEHVQSDILQRLNDFQHRMVFRIFPGVERFLTELRRRGIAVAMVTSSEAEKMARLREQIPHLPDYFDVVIDSSGVTKSKPDPQGYLLAAERLGCDPVNCFVFEDSLQGLLAGRASGARVIAVATTYPAEALKDKADKIITGLDAITVDEMLAVSRL